MNDFNTINDVKLETRFHYHKEILEINSAEEGLLKDIWANNFRDNLKLVEKQKKLDVLLNDKKWEQNECVVVGAGPSLDDDIEALKKYRRQVKIISTDMAAYALIKNGIKPDFIFTKKAHEDVVKLFTGFPTQDLKFVANLLQPPELFKKIKGGVYFYIPFDETTFLNNISALNPQLPKLLNKPSTFVMAFILARSMNFKKIYLLGADFCFDDPQKFYCNDVLADKPHMKDNVQVLKLESIFLDYTMTTKDLYVSSEDFYRIIVMETPEKVFNCSRRSTLYNVDWVYFGEIMKRFHTTKDNIFSQGNVEYLTASNETEKMNEVTHNYFKTTIAKNMFDNINRVSREKNISELINKKSEYSEKNVIICGAGPSLKECIPLLKQYRDHFIVCGVDASLLPLYKAGVEPDFILSIDPCNLSLFFKQYDGTKTALIASVHTHPDAVDAWGNRIYFYFPMPLKRLYYWLLSLIDEYQKIPFIKPLGNCGSTMLIFAHELGFKNVAIAGMDFSYTGDRMYAEHSVSEEIMGFEKIDDKEKIVKNLSKFQLLQRTNCRGEKVYTDAPMDYYARTISGYISDDARYSNITNVTTSILALPFMPFSEYVKRVVK